MEQNDVKLEVFDESGYNLDMDSTSDLPVMEIKQEFSLSEPNLQATSTIINVSNEIILMKNEISNIKNEFLIFKSEIKQQIKEDYSKINVSLDKIFKILSSQDLPRQEVKSKPKQNLLVNLKFPLASSEELSELDNQIRKDVEFRTQLIEMLSKIGGRTGEADGSKVAYKIVDYVFKPEILMEYSWTGVSRGTLREKKPFQLLDGILGVFFEVISLADNRHTIKKNCTIFKDGVLKHAKKRTARKRTRPSDVDPLPTNFKAADEIEDTAITVIHENMNKSDMEDRNNSNGENTT